MSKLIKVVFPGNIGSAATVIEASLNEILEAISVWEKFLLKPISQVQRNKLLVYIKQSNEAIIEALGLDDESSDDELNQLCAIDDCPIEAMDQGQQFVSGSEDFQANWNPGPKPETDWSYVD